MLPQDLKVRLFERFGVLLNSNEDNEKDETQISANEPQSTTTILLYCTELMM